MSARRVTLIVAAALVASLGLAGCSKAPQSAASVGANPGASHVATPQASVEPTAPANIVAKGPITTPPSGSSDRTELLDAARTKLGTTTHFYVYQLFVQGDTALADLDPVSKNAIGRVFVAFERRNGVWTAIGASKFGSTSANAATTARALPSFSSDLIAKIDWKLKKPAQASQPAAGDEASMKASLSKDALTWAETSMSGEGKPYKIAIVHVAKDAKGTWWGRVVVEPTGQFERIEFWAKYDAGAWSGSAQDPEPPAPSTYFPSTVTSKLGF